VPHPRNARVIFDLTIVFGQRLCEPLYIVSCSRIFYCTVRLPFKDTIQTQKMPTRFLFQLLNVSN
jgi:hypothetical protein